MILPSNIRQKIDEIIASNKQVNLKNVQKNLTEKYKTKSGLGKSLIESKNDSLLYSISRMPATFSVINSLLNQLKNQGLLGDINSAFDIGSGTGAGYFALKEFDEKISVSLFERDVFMTEIFDMFQTGEKVQKFDLVKDKISQKAEFVLISYVLSELSDEQRKMALNKLLDMTENYLLIIDTGTPKVWQEMMELKMLAKSLGVNILAPCMCDECALKDDYCQFFARVERSSMHKLVKDATLSYEDEKYFYLLISKKEKLNLDKKRVIRRPVIKTNLVGLVLCSKNGVEKHDFSKKNKENFKLAKKSKINDLI